MPWIFPDGATSLTLVILTGLQFSACFFCTVWRTTWKSPFHEQNLSRVKSQARFRRRGAESVQTSIKETHTHTHLFHVQHEVCACLFARGARSRPTRRGLVPRTHAFTLSQSCADCHWASKTHSNSPLAKPTWWDLGFYLSFEFSHERTRVSLLTSQVKHDYDLLMLKLRSLVYIFPSFFGCREFFLHRTPWH